TRRTLARRVRRVGSRPARKAARMTDQPIQADDAEVSLLGAAMSGYPDLDDLLPVVDASDFYQPFRGDVWAAIERVHRAGNQPDPVSVRLALDATQAKYDPVALFTMT